MTDDTLSRLWVVHFPTGDHIRKYQEPVTHARVMLDHHAALAAVPLDLYHHKDHHHDRTDD